MALLRSVVAAAAVIGLPLAHAWNIELPPCVESFKPFVYSGCFQEGKSSNALVFRSSLDSSTMTVEKCMAECKGNGFRYAGLEYYGICFCGTTVDGPQLDDSKCSFPCSGNKTQTCGADSALSVWQDPTFSNSEAVTVESYKSLGCYSDNSSKGRTLSYPISFDGVAVTTKLCLGACEKKGFPFAGIEYGSECWCGVVLANDTAKVDSSQCDMPCAGDSYATCGGRSHMNLWVATDLESLEPCGKQPGTSTTALSVTTVTTVKPVDTTTTSKPVDTTTTSKPVDTTTTSKPVDTITTSKPVDTTTTSKPVDTTTTKPTTTNPVDTTSDCDDTTTSTTKPATTTSDYDDTTTSTKPTSTNPVDTTSDCDDTTTTSVTKPATTKPVDTTSDCDDTTTTSVTKPMITKPTVTKPTVTKPVDTTSDCDDTTSSSKPTSTTKPADTTTSSFATTTKKPTTTTKQVPNTSTSLCTATVTLPAKCEWQCGQWCAPALPSWNDKNGCRAAKETCEKQISSCFKMAGWPGSVECFKFKAWCHFMGSYCEGSCRGKSCGKSDCWNQYHGGGGNPPAHPPTTTTTVYPCATTPKPAPTTTTPAVPCPPTPTMNICTQPSNDKYGYGPGKPVGGIPLPVVSCNDCEDEFDQKPFKFYNNANTRNCPGFSWYQWPSVCSSACSEQYQQCVSTYSKGCETLGWKDDFHKRDEGFGDAVSRRTSTWGSRGGSGSKSCAVAGHGLAGSWIGGYGSDSIDCWGYGGNKPDWALARCKSQYNDCQAVNQRVNAMDKCKRWASC